MKTADIEAILADPDWLPHRFDENAQAVRFVRLDREGHRRATFITDEHLDNVGDFVAVPVSAINRSILAVAPVHYVFHSAYCCSTLVARMFDLPGRSMGLKEPALLNDIVGWRRRGAPPASVAAVLDLVLALLARPFGQGEAVVIKPSNIVNPLAPAMLGLRDGAHALLLYAPIEDFLSSIAVKGLWGRRWVRQAVWGQMQDGVLVQQFSQKELFELTDLQIAGLGWLSHHAIYAQLADRFGVKRIALCDSRTLLADRQKTVGTAFGHFGIALSDGERERIATGPAFTTNSKDQSPYSADDRERQLENTRAANSDEIAKVAEWIRVVARGVGIDPAPSASLFTS